MDGERSEMNIKRGSTLKQASHSLHDFGKKRHDWCEWKGAKIHKISCYSVGVGQWLRKLGYGYNCAMITISKLSLRASFQP